MTTGGIRMTTGGIRMITGGLQSLHGCGWGDLGDESLEDFAWAGLDEGICTVSDHIDDGLGPSYRGCKLGQKVLLDLNRVDSRLGCHILINRTDRLSEGYTFDSFRKFLCCRLHQRRMEGTAYRKRKGAPSTCFLHLLRCLGYSLRST